MQNTQRERKIARKVIQIYVLFVGCRLYFFSSVVWNMHAWNIFTSIHHQTTTTTTTTTIKIKQQQQKQTCNNHDFVKKRNDIIQLTMLCYTFSSILLSIFLSLSLSLSLKCWAQTQFIYILTSP